MFLDACLLDVCQEIWKRFFVKYDEYIATYGQAVKVLYPIAHCRIVDFWRQHGRVQEDPVDGEDLVLLTDSLCSDLRMHQGIDSRIDIERALTALPPRQREALHLHYVDDLKVAATPGLMGVSENAVKSLLKKALETLRMTVALSCYGPEGELE
jgi:RNA polymerase sigma factor (sigma-70 family)